MMENQGRKANIWITALRNKKEKTTERFNRTSPRPQTPRVIRGPINYPDENALARSGQKKEKTKRERMEGSPLVIQNKNQFRPHQYKSEKELEKLFVQHVEKIFGEKTIYLDLKKKISSAKGISGIPDGFLMDFERNKLFIVEVELSSHDIIRHISNQLIRFKVAMNNAGLKDSLAKEFHEKAAEIGRKTAMADIQELFEKKAGIAIVIDNVSEQLVELVDVLSQDGTDVLAIPFETYTDGTRNQLFKVTTFTKDALEKESKKWTFKWTTVPVEKHLKKGNENLGSLFTSLDSKICSIPGVSQKSRKNWITYQTSPLKNFCTVKFLPDSLEINLKSNQSFKDEKRITKPIKRTSAWTFDRVFTIKTEEQLDYAMKLIRQAYACTCEK